MKNTPSIPALEDQRIYHDLFNHAPIGILRTTVAGKILAANHSFLSILGYTDWQEFSSTTDCNVKNLYVEALERQSILEQMMAESGSVHYDSRWLRRDGSEMLCRLHVRACFDSNGHIRYFDGFVEDITERNAVKQELLASGKRYQSIFENTGTGTIIIENDTIISLANDGFAHLTGYAKEEIEGNMEWTAFIAYDDDLQKMLRYHRSRRQTPDGLPIEYEFTLRDKDNTLKDVFLRVDMIAGTNCSVASLLDTTSLKQTRRSLLESKSQLSGILEAFDGYVYICSAEYTLAFMNSKLLQSLHQMKSATHCYKHLFGLEAPCGWCRMASVLQGTTEKYEYLNPRDGRWYYAVSSPIHQGKDRITRIQTVTIDINEHKLTELALRERETYLHKENIRLRENIGERYKFGSIIGKSPAMQKVYELILRAAATDANVILYGESGTGKELVAREIHQMSERADRTFLPVNCGALPEQLMESEFFGYRRGGFTGADKDKPGYFTRADNGTLFLDELGEIAENVQVKLLRVLEGQGYTPIGGTEMLFSNVRIIAATHRNLRRMLDEGSMREDFFYRIHIIPIHMPPLRQRSEDIPLLVESFLRKYDKDASAHMLSGRQLEMLMQHDWPGNVRELENTIHRYLNLNILEFPGRKRLAQQAGRSNFHDTSFFQKMPLRQASQQFEKDLILHQLEEHKWKRSQTAKALGISRKTLYLKMQLLNIH